MSGPIKPKAPIVGGRTLSPVHWSKEHGVHADLGQGRDKIHVPFQGQTTLATFRANGRPSYENDSELAKMGGTLLNKNLNK